MDRRKYLKTLVAGTAGAGILLQSCEQDQMTTAAQKPAELSYDRTTDEAAREQALQKEKFFDDHEMATIAVLTDIIIPADDVSGSAADAGVPDFIEFIAKDMPQYQTRLRGGLRWLDVQCMKRFDKDFVSCSTEQQIEMIDDIAFPESAKPGMEQGVAFFNTMRDLTACGFFSSKIGIADIGYVGNRPNQWDGVPPEVLAQYGLKYDQRTLDIAVKFDA